MAIDFTTNPGGFFPRLGRILHVAYVMDVYEATLPAVWTSLEAQFLASLQPVVAPPTLQADALTRVASGVMAFAASMALDLLTQTVLADQPSQSGTPASCWAEVIRQMIAQGKTVQANTITVTPTALTGSVGTGVIVTSTKGGNGLVRENTVAETLRAVCVADSYSGTVTAGREQFSVVGAPATAGTWDYDYPSGSGAVTALNAVAADQDATTTGNLLTNGDFEDWTADATPQLNFWTLTGTWGTAARRTAVTVYQGLYAVEWLAGGGINVALTQPFNDSTLGTAAVPAPLTSYAHNVWLQRQGVVTAGVLTVELVDSTGTVVNDAQGVANSTTITLSALTTGFVAHNVVFRLPANPPTLLNIRYRMSTALTGANVVMDSAAFAPLTAMYTGGPGIAIFSGATPFVAQDGWSIADTNDQGGATNLATFQTGCDRLYDMKSMGLLVPSSGAPNIANTLITS